MFIIGHRIYIKGLYIYKGCIYVEFRVLGFRVHMGVSENRGPLFWGPYNRDPTI